jgi:hypothetical protein
MNARRGYALVGTLIVTVALIGLLYATSRVTVTEVRDPRTTTAESVQTRYLAEAGIERALNLLARGSRRGSGQDPLGGLSRLFKSGSKCSPFVAEPLASADARIGSYSVTLTLTEQSPTSVLIMIESTGYRPEAPQKLSADRPPPAWSALRTFVRYSIAPSHVFDYAYCIDNWCWFYGGALTCHGNLRCNGQFDAAGGTATISGQALYDAVGWDGTKVVLSGCHDDNGDAARDGGDGGLWSGWAITGAQHLQGNGARAQNQHPFQAPLPLPNLCDLGSYEASARQQQGSISIDGVQVCDAVLGDEPGEKQNLFLLGTAASPIVLKGPVVVRGQVILGGYVTGQGAIYAGGNIYCPSSVLYQNAPATRRPEDGTQAAAEAWLAANWNKDFLALFARENVVVGDFTDPVWQQYQSQWLADPQNVSAEDCGLDGLPNTRAGRDGVLGTADDDVLEGDGLFSIQHYTQQDADLGLLPPGAKVGEPIPGSGEDLDGDGVQDGPASLAGLILTTPLDREHWAGNLPADGIASYHQIASMSAAQLDAVVCSGHAFCWTVLGGREARLNGALACRNENILNGTPALQIDYDCRLLGGATSRAARLLPLGLQAPEVLPYTPMDRDPNRGLVLP